MDLPYFPHTSHCTEEKILTSHQQVDELYGAQIY